MSTDLNFDFFKVNFDRVTPKEGRVLIAEPGLIDLNFKRSVVFLVEHNDNGTVGFVLNRLLNYNLSDLLPDFPDFKAKISLGGPVSPQSIHFIHTLGNIIPETTHIIDNIYWGGSFDSLKSLMEAKKISTKQIIFFVGYSGWGKDQLEREITEGSWVVSSLNPIQIFGGGEDLWIDTVRQLGNKFRPWTLYPEDPSMN